MLNGPPTCCLPRISALQYGRHRLTSGSTSLLGVDPYTGWLRAQWVPAKTLARRRLLARRTRNHRRDDRVCPASILAPAYSIRVHSPGAGSRSPFQPGTNRVAILAELIDGIVRDVDRRRFSPGKLKPRWCLQASRARSVAGAGASERGSRVRHT